MSEEPEFADTERKVGQLLPVLVNPKGDIVDGRHRLKANKNWRRITVDLNDLQTHVARLVINTQRRIADEEDYKELAEFLQKNEPGDKPYRVASGKSIAERISELTGINADTVRLNLDEQFKGDQGGTGVPQVLGKGERVRVPKPLAEPVRQLVDQIKELVEADPDGRNEIIKACSETLSMVPALSRRVKRSRKKAKSPSDEDWSPTHFIKRLNKASSDVTFLISLPTGVVKRVLGDMNGLDRETCQTLIRDLVEAATKLQKALEALQ